MLLLVPFVAEARIFDFYVSSDSSGVEWDYATEVTVYCIPSDEPGTKSFIVWYREGADTEYTLDGTITADSTIIDLGTAMGVYFFKVQQKRQTVEGGYPKTYTTPFDEAPIRSVRIGLMNHANDDTLKHAPPVTGNANKYLQVSADGTKIEWDIVSAIADTIVGLNDSLIVRGTHIPANADSQVTTKGVIALDGRGLTLSEDGGKGITVVDGTGAVLVDSTVDGVDIAAHAGDDSTKHLPSLNGHAGEFLVVASDSSKAEWSAGSVAAHDINGVQHTGIPLDVDHGGTGHVSFTNGQLLIGNTTPDNDLDKATLTGGEGIRIANGAGSITVIMTKTDIDSVGTIAEGTWQGSGIDIPYGGTNNTSFTTLQFLRYNSGLGKIESSGFTDASFITGTDLTDHTGDTTIHFIKGNIDSVGTIAEGTWHGSMLIQDYGGTGFTSYTNGQLLIGKTTPGTEMVRATLTAGDGMYVTNGEGSITLSIKKSDIDSVGVIGEGTWHGSKIVYSYLDTGIGNTKILRVDHASPVLYDYAKFTSNGIEGRSYAETKTDLSLNNVDNTSLASWAGTANVTTLGTITTGTWSGTTVAVNKGGTGQTTYTDGQLLIGKTLGNTLLKGSISGGTGITVSPGGGTITLSVTGSTYAPYAHNQSATTITSGTLAVTRGGTGNTSFTGNRVIVSDVTGGFIKVSSINTTELGHLSGLNTNVETHQSNTTIHYTKASITQVGTIAIGAWEATDVSIAAGGTGSSTAAGARTNLGLGTMAVKNVGVTGTFYSLESSFKGPGDGQLHHMRKAITVTDGIVTTIGASTDYDSGINLP